LELLDGCVVAFAGGTVVHGVLCTKIVSLLAGAADPACYVFTSDVALELAQRPGYYFPDASYTCEKLEASATKIRAPKLVVEVISPDSQSHDRVEKLDAYQSVAAVDEYLLIDSRRVWVCLFRRFGPSWTESVYGLGDSFQLDCVRLTVSVDELYAGLGRSLN